MLGTLNRLDPARRQRIFAEADAFVARVRLQQREGYLLAGLWDGDSVCAVAGYRIGNNLAWGKYLYVDDLVTDGNRRSEGHGKQLLDWLCAQAREQGCDQAKQLPGDRCAAR